MHTFSGKLLVKRIVSSLLTCSLALSVVSQTAFAADTGQFIDTGQSTAQEDELIGTAGGTFTVDKDGNIVSSSFTNTGQTNTGQTPTEPTSNNSSNNIEDTEDSSEENTDKVIQPDINPPDKFDKYYSLIDDNIVQTNTLFMKVSDPSVITEGTNIVSNSKDMYVVSFSSVIEARYAYSYYVRRVKYISDLSNSIVLASDNANNNTTANTIADISTSNTTKDYSGYIAVIDTGAGPASGADAYLSVFNDKGLDYNGHGTEMIKYIKEENPNAKVLSIKAFEGRSTNVVNLYTGIRLAIDSNVDVINLSLAGYDIETNAIIIDIIQEALDKGIKVIGAAGNYNASALNYIPGCIEGVITVGAVNSDFTKCTTSNYDADVYVVANSTSVATAKYTGMLTVNNIDEKCVTDTLKDQDDYEVPEGNGTKYHSSASTHSDKKAA